MLDTKGPEIRTGKLKDKTVTLEVGQQLLVVTDQSVLGDNTTIVLDYQDLAESAKVGNKILIADGTIGLTITEVLKEKKAVRCTVNNACTLGENKNVHLPGRIFFSLIDQVLSFICLLFLKKIDWIFFLESKRVILFHVCNPSEVDLIAASFIRTADDVRQIRLFFDKINIQSDFG